MTDECWLYMLECRDGSIYTGIARDPVARYALHIAGKGAKYTKMNPPTRLLVAVRHDGRRAAAQAEIAMKRLSRVEKLRWISEHSSDADSDGIEEDHGA